MKAKPEEFSVSKSTVVLYKIRHQKSGCYWADITIDESGSKGRINIASDYGNYSNYWHACGSSFKEFLLKIGKDYAASKFGADHWFDHENTINEYKRAIIFQRRCLHLSEEEARKLFKQVKEMEDIVYEQEFVHEMLNKTDLMRFLDNMPGICRSITPQFNHFWEDIWPIFLGELKKELEQMPV